MSSAERVAVGLWFTYSRYFCELMANGKRAEGATIILNS
jgi:hypothetical protein